MDKRTKHTMEQIKSTLLGLLDTHSFETITVTMICEQTSISRRTFYNHFSDKFEVIDEIMNDYTQAIRQ
ncbi:MAG: TetR/AcrR family transcriptional regulator, partial [Staphylococcus simulans]|nr:TetR/AcrR family transcriptional regulator [Staphylococcus simulans]